jgi:ubiquinone/menaquinone biosynthesis C-methylase UbiE
MRYSDREAAHERALRLEEVGVLLDYVGTRLDGCDLLEIGSGEGLQLNELAKRCKSVQGIDIAESPYTNSRVAPIRNYDGRHIPFADASFDVVYSSNALEHIAHLDQIQLEIRRVLRPRGIAIHVLPTHSWRFWTSVSHYPSLFRHATFRPDWQSSFRAFASSVASSLVAPRHGERGSRLTEYFYFRPSWWSQRFRSDHWQVEFDRPIGIFYTGNLFLGPSLSMNARRSLARWLGSACHLFVLQPV